MLVFPQITALRRIVPLLACTLASLALVACGGSRGSESNELLRLPALRAVPDPLHGGRFVDAEGRHVILRGVNVNAFVEYWQGTDFPTTFPLFDDDPERIAAIGWNVVRLLASWSRIEPQPGVYDEAYLDQLEAAVRALEAHGIYSLLDLHQDAWGPSLAARPDEVCGQGRQPAFGWDGAPEWATLADGRSRCTPGQRELSPAVRAAFAAFWNDEPGPGGVGIRTRYAAMLGHLAARFAGDPAVAGIDVMNEPNAFTPFEEASLAALHGEAIAAIRAAQAHLAGPGHIVFFEPSILWSSTKLRPLDFPRDDNLAYAPHLYQGGLDTFPVEPQFASARADADAFDGVPVLTGEWGGDPRRAENPQDDFFLTHQRLQDEFLFGAALWTWRESCGDPHKAADFRDGREPYVWGLFEVDCATNEVTGEREPLRRQLTRAYVRAAPGRITSMEYDPERGTATAAGVDAPIGGELLAFYPASQHGRPRVEASGLAEVRVSDAAGGNAYVRAHTTAAQWSLALHAD